MRWIEIGAWGIIVLWGRAFFPACYGILFPRFLKDVSPITGEDLPTISIIVPARDEASAIEESLEHLLKVCYPRLEVIAIDDRSTDETGVIMDRMAAFHDSRLKVIHVTELPAGWLGKNHALALGAAESNADFLLLTDGDVMIDPLTLRRAMSVVHDRKLDHLVLLPEIVTSTFLEIALINFFCLLLMTTTQFPLVRWSWFKNAYLGVGAFNLVRRTAYDAIGGFSKLQLEVADDLMLGRSIKHAGLLQDVYGGQKNVWVKWQQGGVWSIVKGLEKNAFAASRYSMFRTLLACITILGISVVPIGALACGVAVWQSSILIVGTVLLSLGTARTVGFPLAVGFLYPWAAVVFCYIMTRSMVLTIRQGGVRWRDTFYSLNDLRNGCEK